MNFPAELRYSKTHEWVKLEGDTAVVGLTDYAQSQLGDIVFLNLPAAGDAVAAGAPMGEAESVKAVSDLYCPVSGIVSDVNQTLEENPQLINESPYEAWLVKVEQVSETGELLTAEEYAALTAAEE